MWSAIASRLSMSTPSIAWPANITSPSAQYPLFARKRPQYPTKPSWPTLDAAHGINKNRRPGPPRRCRRHSPVSGEPLADFCASGCSIASAAVLDQSPRSLSSSRSSRSRARREVFDGGPQRGEGAARILELSRKISRCRIAMIDLLAGAGSTGVVRRTASS